MIGSVAIRTQVETCDRNEKRPDCERARKLVPKAMADEMRCAEALEQGCVRLLFV